MAKAPALPQPWPISSDHCLRWRVLSGKTGCHQTEVAPSRLKMALSWITTFRRELLIVKTVRVPGVSCGHLYCHKLRLTALGSGIYTQNGPYLPLSHWHRH